ncbi:MULTISPECIES: hypothetical protein [unclassified Psychrobacillus]|uniref:hypothetical protein n=1 Tax=unclassified Psychrobacillus TaxID=2636677 RepID=UPI0030F5EB69
MNELPIDPILLRKRMAIPELIAKLSYQNQTKSIEYIRIWGEKRMSITELYGLLTEELGE